ncbi:hypothetical protein [Terasakiella pusilla]|uniref:hypothetical protein n=1 Tax=Terasakiella pusilla TaxID=64973 RepID=UPI0012EB5D8F|nr:hypothetical protein [Terasakiella pusilla]
MKKFVELQSDANSSVLHQQFTSLHFHIFGKLLGIPWRCTCLAQLVLQAATDPEDVVNGVAPKK